MVGIRIFMHALRMVHQNWQDALRIGLAPIAFCLTAVVVLLGVLGLPLTIGLTGPAVDMQPDLRAATGMFGAAALWVLCNIWIFVNWHRFVLLSEYPQGWIPPFHRDRMGAYFWKSVQMGLYAAGALLPVVLIIMVIPTVGALLIMLWVGLAVYGFFRVSPVLPGAAIGEPLGLAEAWQATRPGAGAIALVIILLLVLDQAASMVGGAIININVALGIVVTAALWAVTSLINVSVLTTLHGHYIQNRPLE